MPLFYVTSIQVIWNTVFIRLNASLDQTPQMEAKLQINAALE